MPVQGSVGHCDQTAQSPSGLSIQQMRMRCGWAGLGLACSSVPENQGRLAALHARVGPRCPLDRADGLMQKR